jgi:hypothetical protein
MKQSINVRCRSDIDRFGLCFGLLAYRSQLFASRSVHAPLVRCEDGALTPHKAQSRTGLGLLIILNEFIFLRLTRPI